MTDAEVGGEGAQALGAGKPADRGLLLGRQLAIPGAIARVGSHAALATEGRLREKNGSPGPEPSGAHPKGSEGADRSPSLPRSHYRRPDPPDRHPVVYCFSWRASVPAAQVQARWELPWSSQGQECMTITRPGLPHATEHGPASTERAALSLAASLACSRQNTSTVYDHLHQSEDAPTGGFPDDGLRGQSGSMGEIP